MDFIYAFFGNFYLVFNFLPSFDYRLFDKKYFKNPSSSDSNLSDNKRCYSSSSTSNFEESPIIISDSHENLNREDYLIKRKKNNASARKCREKRKKQMAMVFTKVII